MALRTASQPATARLANPLAALVESIADRIHASGDAEARAYGLTVERLPWGGRRIYDPRLPERLEQRRRDAVRYGLDAVDHALLDKPTEQLLAATARNLHRK